MDKNNNNSKPTRRDFIWLHLNRIIRRIRCRSFCLANCKSNESDSSVKAMSTVEVDISKVDKGKEITELCGEVNQYLLKEEPRDEITKARNISLGVPHPETDKERVLKDEWLVVVGICTHLDVFQ